LAFSRKQILQPRLFDLNAVVRDAERMLARLIGDDVTLLTDLAPNVVPVRADPGQFHQVLLNLAVNARDAMPRGGTLTIRTVERELRETIADVGGPEAAPGRYVILEVCDTGVGISEEVKPYLFEPFFTTKEDGKGTGLGLSTVYGIVKQSGGYVEVESTVGRGTTFRIYLPRAEMSVPAADPAPVPEWPRGAETVLLVEDEEAVRRFARLTLERAGYTVLEARDGEEGLHVCRTHPGRIDILVTDVAMPRLGGRALAEEALRQRPKLRVLYLSGYTDDPAVRLEAAGGDSAFLQKPFSPYALVERVRTLLDRGDSPSAAASTG
ncbi:MAG TPA: ATP-binding protein, partial [Methylomirabilota bacterium]|nr:ATP-binding protein [Methylomirabilota bacterium]